MVARQTILKVAINNLSRSFVVALIILLLLMAALFRSFLDSLLVMMALPLATIGGVVALLLLKLQADLLTLIGFIILLGLVVNNAILLVYQARTSEREGLSRTEAVRTSSTDSHTSDTDEYFYNRVWYAAADCFCRRWR